MSGCAHACSTSIDSWLLLCRGQKSMKLTALRHQNIHMTCTVQILFFMMAALLFWLASYRDIWIIWGSLFPATCKMLQVHYLYQNTFRSLSCNLLRRWSVLHLLSPSLVNRLWPDIFLMFLLISCFSSSRIKPISTIYTMDLLVSSFLIESLNEKARLVVLYHSLCCNHPNALPCMIWMLSLNNNRMGRLLFQQRIYSDSWRLSLGEAAMPIHP